MAVCEMTSESSSARRWEPYWWSATSSIGRPRCGGTGRILQAQFHAKFIRVVESHFHQQGLDRDLGRGGVECDDHSLISLKYRGVALISSVLLIVSGTTMTSRSICSNGLTSPSPDCSRSRREVRKLLTAVATF